MEEQTCHVHGLLSIGLCGWCGDAICEECLLANNGRKYCVRCYSKISKNTVASYLDKKHSERFGEAPTEKVLNVDSTLDEEEIKRKREMLNIKERTKSVLNRERKY